MCMFNSIIAETGVTVSSFFICTVVSLALGMGAAMLYMFKNRYTQSFVITLAMLPAVVQLVIMLVNGNIGTGLAVAGAFTLVRFRSVAGTAKEISMIFLSTPGLSCITSKDPSFVTFYHYQCWSFHIITTFME